VNEVQAQEILAALPTYEIVDITVVSTDGKLATADVVYTKDGGELQTTRIEYARVDGGGTIVYDEGSTGAGFASLSQEIADECREACMYQRDLLRSKN
jgi:hypothetical protein